LVRHQHEADILCATQRLQWDWGRQQAALAPTSDEYVRRISVDETLKQFLV